MCKADPPGWRYDKRGRKEWYEGGVNYNKSHVPVEGYQWPLGLCGVCWKRVNCLYCGRWMDEDQFVQSEGEKVTTTD